MSKELVKKDGGALAVASKINDMFGGGAVQIPVDAPLPQIKALRESPLFELPDGETAKAVTGHIIYWHNANQYYASDYGEGDSSAPDCSSSDGVKPDGGENIQCSVCRECPMNEYGSAKTGQGKACQNTIRMYILVDGEVIPSVIKAAPSSLGSKESVMKWLTHAPNVANKAGAGTSYQPIKVTISLHRKDFDSGFSASVLDMKTERVLDASDADDMAYLERLSSLFKEFKESYLGRVKDDVANEAAGNAQETSGDDVPI